MSELIKNVKEDVALTKLLMTESSSNPRGIPAAKFIENVDEFLGEHTVESALGSYQELYGKYKYMESHFEKSKAVYKGKLPDITQTLDTVTLLKAQQDAGEAVYTNYSLSDTVFAKAKIDTSVGKVCLWIGASTMVEYTYDEAIELLKTQLAQTESKIKETNEDLACLRENSITVEVNMARLFNHNVKMKKLAETAK